MKPINLLIIAVCSSLTLFISTDVRGQVNVRTGNTTIKTNPAGGVSVSTDGTTINTNRNNIDDGNNYHFDRNGNSLSNYRIPPTLRGQNRFKKVCHQENTQTTQISGSNRRVLQSTTSHCY